MNRFSNDYTLIIIVQCISGASLVRFGESSRELWRTFVFKLMVFYYVIIPDKESKKHLWMPTDVIKPQTKFQVDSASVTWKIYQSLYRKIFYPSSGIAVFWSVLSIYIVLHGLMDILTNFHSFQSEKMIGISTIWEKTPNSCQFRIFCTIL